MQRPLAEVEAEARAAGTLADSGLPLARPLMRLDGNYAGIIEHGPRTQVALTYAHVDGDEVVRPDRQQAIALGRTISTLHTARSREPVEALDLPVCEPLRGSGEGPLLARRWLDREDAAWLERTTRTALARLEHLAPLGGSALCHGDLRLGNVRFSGGETPVATLLDLEAMGHGPRAYDLGCFWRRRVLEADFTRVPEDWAWFRQGYSSGVTLEDEEWQALPLYALLRSVWTMCLPARPGATWGSAWAMDRDYWAAHLRMARWFATAAEL